MSDVETLFANAIAALEGGRVDEARDHAHRLWRHATDPRAALLLAQLEIDAGRVEEASLWHDRARASAPANPAIALQAAQLLALAGKSSAAYDRYVEICRRSPQAERAWRQFAALAIASGRTREATAFLRAAARQSPPVLPALQALLDVLPDTPLRDANAPAAAHASSARREPISIVTCSNDDRRFVAMARAYARALGDWPHDIVRIADARSIAEGYTRGLPRARGSVILFSHDDVDLLALDFGDRMMRHLATCDILGIAGASRATGPAWAFAGHPHLHGCVIYPNAAGYDVTVYSQSVPLTHGMRVMDGVFLAMRRAVAESVGWDAQVCDGFHGYDVDFTLRAADRGLDLAVATDLGIVHGSYGTFDDAWRATGAKLMQKHPALRGGRGALTGFFRRTVADASRALALVDRWSHAAGEPEGDTTRVRPSGT